MIIFTKNNAFFDNIGSYRILNFHGYSKSLTFILFISDCHINKLTNIIMQLIFKLIYLILHFIDNITHSIYYSKIDIVL